MIIIQVNEAKLDEDLNQSWEVLAEPVQTVSITMLLDTLTVSSLILRNFVCPIIRGADLHCTFIAEFQ